MTKEIKTNTHVRNDLLDVYRKLKSKKISLRDAKECANVAGKIFTSGKLQLEYNAYTKSVKRIEFFED